MPKKTKTWPKQSTLEAAFDRIERMRRSGFAVRMDNGLDGTWEVVFYKPGPEPFEKIGNNTYGAGATLLKAVTASMRPICGAKRPKGGK